MIKGIEIEGRTVEEAIQKGLKALSLDSKDVEVKILDEGKAGLFGLMGASPAKVKVSPKNGVIEKKNICISNIREPAQEALQKTLKLMGITATISSSIKENNLYFDIKSEDKALLIGKEGQTLSALQLLINLIADKSYTQRIRIDVENYRLRKDKKINCLAKSYADEVKKTGKKKIIGSLSAHERRIIHSALQSDTFVQTASEGVGIHRKIIISPKERLTR